MRRGGDLENVDPDELGAWMTDAAGALQSRKLSRDEWLEYDTAQRFGRNHEMQLRVASEWYMSRADHFDMARSKLAYARKMLEHGQRLAAIDTLLEADKWRRWGRGTWPDVHDHPVNDPAARNAALRAARKAAQPELVVGEQLVAYEAYGKTFMLTPSEVERADAMRARGPRIMGEPRALTADEDARWRSYFEAERIRRGLPMEGDGDVAIGVRFKGDGRLAPRPTTMAPPAAGAYEATLEQLGMRRDAHGVWWVTPPGGEP